MKRAEVFDGPLEEVIQLSKTDLPEPKDLVLKIDHLYKTIYAKRNNYTFKNYTHYISTIELWNGKFLERTFAHKLDNRRKGLNRIIYKEVARKIEGNINRCIKDLYHFRIAGLQTIWNPKRYGYYSYLEPTGKFIVDEIDYFRISSFKYYYDLMDEPNEEFFRTNIKIMNNSHLVKLDPTIKYCAYDEDKASDFIQYISWFRKMPEIEMYAKKGILHLITDYRFANRCKKDKKFAAFVRKNLDDIRENRLNYQEINAIYRYGNIRRWRIEVEFKKLKHLIDGTIMENKEKIIRYLDSKPYGQNLQYYLDYYQAAKEFNQDMSIPKLLLPHDISHWHDHYIALKKAKANEEFNENLNKVISRLSKLNYKDQNFIVMVAPTQESIIFEGEKLQHCVGRLGYIKRMAEGENAIFFLREVEKVNEPFYTIEYDHKKNKIVQIRGMNNSQKIRFNEVKEFTDQWLKEIPKLKKARKKIEHSNSNRKANKGSRTEVHTELAAVC